MTGTFDEGPWKRASEEITPFLSVSPAFQGPRGEVGPQGPAGPNLSNPPVGKYRVTNLYVDPASGTLTVEYDDIPA